MFIRINIFYLLKIIFLIGNRDLFVFLFKKKFDYESWKLTFLKLT